MRGSELVAAVEEERFTRVKHQGGIPVHAFRWCLDAAGVSIDEVDAVAVGIDPDALSDRRASFGLSTSNGAVDESRLRAVLGIEAPITFVAHHRAHAASAFHFSAFSDAAVLVADGVGDWPCTSLWHGSTASLELLESWDFPNSLGLFYAMITSWLGFRVNNDEYKVMGLAAHGEPRLTGLLERVLRRDAGGYHLDRSFLGMVDRNAMYSGELTELLGPARIPDEPLLGHHRDVAASAQFLLEEHMLALAVRAHEQTSAKQLCVAGGVGLNAVANARLVADGPFDDVFFQPAAGDAGTALGAASTAMLDLGGPRPVPLTDLRLGPRFTNEGAADSMRDAGVDFVVHDDDALVVAVADLIAAGKTVGWFRGSMEFGPRALGARSLIADPRSSATRDRINLFLKGREAWRPLAPMVSDKKASTYFDSDRTLRFMVETAAVRDEVVLDAVTHVDGTARPQRVDAATMPLLASLLAAVEDRIGVAALVSTSFNHASEPIVMTPQDAMLSASRLGLDALVIENCLLVEVQPTAFDRVAAWCTADELADSGPNLYPS